MNAAHLHLIFTHLPIVGLGIAILLNLYAILNKSDELKKLTLIAYVVLGLFALLAYLTGDDAGELLKKFPGISTDKIETHENIAFLFLIGTLILSAVSAIGWYVTRKNQLLLKKFNVYLFIAALLLSILAVKTGLSGAQIRHPEIIQEVIK